MNQYKSGYRVAKNVELRQNKKFQVVIANKYYGSFDDFKQAINLRNKLLGEAYNPNEQPKYKFPQIDPHHPSLSTLWNPHHDN
jgi:hypothetical protein